jgi:hypothetical protein
MAVSPLRWERASEVSVCGRGGAAYISAMPEDVDPDDLFVTDDAYAAGRRAFTAGARSCRTRWLRRGLGQGWFAGWLDALADAVTGQDRAAAAFARLLRRDHAEPF